MSKEETTTNNAFFLPDFCAGRTTLSIVLIAELVAVIVALARQSISQGFWADLAAISLFLLWIGLGSAFVMCRTSAWLAKQTVVVASTISLAILAAIVVIVSEVVFRLGDYLSGGAPAVLAFFPADHGPFLLRNLAIGFIVSAMTLRYFHVSAERKRTIELAAQARINALQARIRPHFLFNSMNTIASLTRSDPAKAEQAVEDLADLFRANLSDARKNIRFNEEVEVARVYARIENLRLGERLRVSWRIDDIPPDAMVPSLLLQPLIENAVYHGIERLPHGGEVIVAGSCKDGSIELLVENPVAPQSSARAESEHSGHKLALDNIKQRLELAWPGEAGLSINSSAELYRVILKFPYRQREQ